MLLYAGNQISLFARIEALKRHFASGKILIVVVVVLLGRFVGVKEFCAFGDHEFSSTVFFFFGLNFVGAIVRNFEVIIFWISPMRKFCFIGFAPSNIYKYWFNLEGRPEEASTLGEDRLREVSILNEDRFGEDYLGESRLREVSIPNEGRPEEGSVLGEGHPGEVNVPGKNRLGEVRLGESRPREVSLPGESCMCEVSVLNESRPEEVSVLGEGCLEENRPSEFCL